MMQKSSTGYFFTSISQGKKNFNEVIAIYIQILLL